LEVEDRHAVVAVVGHQHRDWVVALGVLEVEQSRHVEVAVVGGHLRRRWWPLVVGSLEHRWKAVGPIVVEEVVGALHRALVEVERQHVESQEQTSRRHLLWRWWRWRWR
jgi:hypothetical protein